MTENKIAIIGASEFQVPLIEKCKELGYTTYVYAWRCGDVGEKIADFFVPISVVEKETIYQDIVSKGIKSCVSIGSDITQLTVNYVLRKLNIRCNKEITDVLACNKYEMRKAFRSNGILCPQFMKSFTLPTRAELESFRYPLIVKPTDRSGSRGIYKVNNYEELCECFESSKELSFEKACIIEEYIEGKEYSCETISFNGKHTILSLTEKHTTGAPHFIETGHDEPADISIDENIICRVLDSLHIEYGAGHTEFRVDDKNELWVIETGARMGGDCIGSDLVPLSTGYDFLKMVIDTASGKEPDYTKSAHQKESHIRFIFNEKDIEEMNNHKIIKKSIKDMDFNNSVSDSTSRHGYYIY